MTRTRAFVSCTGALWLAIAFMAAPAAADVFRPAYLELREREGGEYDVLWRTPAQGERKLALYLRLPDGARDVTAPRSEFRDGSYTERRRIAHAEGFDGSVIGIDGLAGSSAEVLVRIVRSDGGEQVERLAPTKTSIVIAPRASVPSVARTYFVLGVHHILIGLDHLLFVLALLVIVRGFGRIAVTITAFTLAHSLTLAAATLGFVDMPSAPVEAVIALSIVFVAAEIVRGLQGRPGLTARRPWVVAFTFGLLHGLGFAGALSEVGLPAHAIPTALLFFNVGVEAGQLAFVGAVSGAIALLRRFAFGERALPEARLQYATAYCIGGLAMMWTIERCLAFVA